MAEIPEWANQYPVRCEVCGDMVGPGKGRLSQRVGQRRHGQGRWQIDHLECPGARPWQLQNDGRVYALSGVGPDGDYIKIGMTAGSLIDRIFGHFGTRYLPFPVNLRKVLVWASATEGRFAAEAIVHQELAQHRIHPSLKMGRELFKVDVDRALSAIEKATGEHPNSFPWDLSGNRLALSGDEIPNRGASVWLHPLPQPNSSADTAA